MTHRLRTLPIVFGLLFFLWIAFPACAPSTVTNKPGGLEPGDMATDFSLLDSNGQMVHLSSVPPNTYLVLIFYRGYWCSACQNQLFGLKDDYPQFLKLHSIIYAVSTDLVEECLSFNQQWRFPYTLLSDVKLNLIGAYGAINQAGHNGHPIAHPTVIIIDPSKKIRYKYVGKNPQDRPADDEILAELQREQNVAAGIWTPMVKR
jgi:peroxiredoxin